MRYKPALYIFQRRNFSPTFQGSAGILNSRTNGLTNRRFGLGESEIARSSWTVLYSSQKWVCNDHQYLEKGYECSNRIYNRKVAKFETRSPFLRLKRGTNTFNTVITLLVYELYQKCNTGKSPKLSVFNTC